MESGSPERVDAQLRQYLEVKYSTAPVNDRERMMEALVGLMEYARDEKESLHSFLDRAAETISRSLGFEEIVIGLHDREKNDYYHEVVFGYGNDIPIGLKQLRYSREDLASQRRSMGVRIGKLSEFSPVEGMSEPKRKLLDVPPAGADSARFLDKFRRGDFIDTWMRDQRKNLIGWIGVSRPHHSRFPPKIDVLWLELTASICACVISWHWQKEDLARRANADGR